MTTSQTERRNPPDAELAKLEELQNLGDYFSLRKMAKRLLKEKEEGAKSIENISDLLKRTEPNPLVFLIGLGSVVVAFALAVCLAY